MSTNRTIATETGPAEVNPKTRRDARITVAEHTPGFDDASPGSVPPSYAKGLTDICDMLGIREEVPVETEVTDFEPVSGPDMN